MSYPTEELIALGTRLVQEVEQRGARLRLLGGLAFYITCPGSRQVPKLQRNYQDLDFMINRKGVRPLTEAFMEQGWEPDRHFNSLHGATRNLFTYQEQLQADIFVSVFDQSQRLDLEKRLVLCSPTLSLADLLLTKLQIHRLNTKDVQDIFTLVYDHEFGPARDQEKIDLDYLSRLTGNNWGWYTSIQDNVATVLPMVKDFFDAAGAELVEARLQGFSTALTAAPKTPLWRARDLVGRRVEWFDEPEEVNR